MVACDVYNGVKNESRRRFYCVLGRRVQYYSGMWLVHANRFVSPGIGDIDENYKVVQKEFLSNRSTNVDLY